MRCWIISEYSTDKKCNIRLNSTESIEKYEGELQTIWYGQMHCSICYLVKRRAVTEKMTIYPLHSAIASREKKEKGTREKNYIKFIMKKLSTTTENASAIYEIYTLSASAPRIS